MTVLITAAAAVTEEPAPTAADAPHWFDPAAHLGRRGWKYFSPATRYLLAAGNQALGRRHDDPPLDGAAAERFGVVTGTQYAITRVHRRMDTVLTTEGVHGISPAEVPGFSMNTPGSQLAISTGARAFSVTLTNPVTAGLEAVQFAVTALRTGRADRVVAAATDQAPRDHGGSGEYDAAAAVVLSAGHGAADGPRPLAAVTGGLSRFLPPGPAGGPDPAALTAAGTRIAALARATDTVRLVIGGPAGAAPLAGAGGEATAKALADAGAAVRHPAGEIREARHCAVSGLLELIDAARAGGPALVISVSETGHLTAIGLGDPVGPEFI
ncbi:beta-ketoacyl synthase N-terminal-like domain-containing protein [Streptomyces sp. DH24]|uniref:beta-ketoacyl synthase N-terminal-like domain-containing protein n=1 Tax=Streptomyces sp. DH24 TaxID=3040123 RepID=UPI0024436A67|nr:beta-ketoacyl synthase N-terminal-like domain-containing protein [Streptomyces sp. DH24]MDG9719800.1 beta-ketoacyl synthase N-terminal-like domain-containing protein [Streptomyces sp. DH24]